MATLELPYEKVYDLLHMTSCINAAQAFLPTCST